MKTLLKTVICLVPLMSLAPQAKAATSKNQRNLVVYSELTTFGLSKYEWLYQFLDTSTISMARAVLGPHYKAVYALSGNGAKKSNFVNALKYATSRAGVKAVDVILSAHGSTNKIWFKDGSLTTGSLQARIQAQVPHRSRLRLMYNLACYGSTHNNEFRASGFRVALGARKVNTSSAHEYPQFLAQWAGGVNVGAIIASTNANPSLNVSDSVAKPMGFSSPDSRKIISGTQALKINYNAQ